LDWTDSLADEYDAMQHRSSKGVLETECAPIRIFETARKSERTRELLHNPRRYMDETWNEIEESRHTRSIGRVREDASFPPKFNEQLGG
jgi:hypothetical protein